MAMTAKQKTSDQAAGIKYGCHVDLEHGVEPDGCVKQDGRDSDCLYAPRHKTREGCKYWMPVSLSGKLTFKEAHLTEQFKSPCLPPEGLPRELLTILGEECAETFEVMAERALARIQIRASKALRFGMDEVQPGQPLTNAQRLAREIGDFQEVVEQLVAAGVLHRDEIEIGRANKKRQLAKFLQSAT